MAKKQRRNVRTGRQSFVSYDDAARQYIPPEPPQVKKSFHLKDLKRVNPLTQNQEEMFFNWYDGDRHGYVNDVIGATGAAGTGKSLLACYFGLQAILDENTPYMSLYIIRSVVPSRDIGFLPGDETQKTEPFTIPYKQIFDKLFPWTKSFDNMRAIGLVDFEVSSFMRGQTLEDCIVFIDEVQNMTEVEFETILTRLGKNARIIFAGDTQQNDLGSKSGFSNVLRILKQTGGVAITEFGVEDIVRSGFVKRFLTAKYKLG